jgi:hypothetical protein
MKDNSKLSDINWIRFLMVLGLFILIYLFIFIKPSKVSTTTKYGPIHNYIIPDTNNIDDTEHIWIGGNGDTIIE